MKNKTLLGICCGSHDASVSVIRNNDIIFASQSERYSRVKNDKDLNSDLLIDALNSVDGQIDMVCFYEQPWLKKTRQLRSLQIDSLINDNVIFDIKSLFYAIYGNKFDVPLKYVNHHSSHAGLAFASPYDKAIVLIIDSIGEWNTCSIWLYDIRANKKLKKLWCANYPYSLGLMYSAFTQYVGLKPNEEEYIFMGMSSYGKSHHDKYIRRLISKANDKFINLHRGLPNKVKNDFIFNELNDYDIAASVQKILEDEIDKMLDVVKHYQDEYHTTNLVYGGGVALNCVANSKIQKRFPNMWIYQNPGDSGSSLGAILYVNNQQVKYTGPYLGYKIKGRYPIDNALKSLLTTGIVGIANGKAEFGPRALGNRSLLANPAIDSIKDKVNEIKHRQKFRPFAPVILEEEFVNYYDSIVKCSPYMQYVYKAKENNRYDSVQHIDKTSRVQTINSKQHPQLYKLLKTFYNITGCPMLLNTSLNIRGMPIVNNERDAKDFENTYNVPVYIKNQK